MQGAKKKVELVRTRTQERGCEQLFYGIRVDTRRSKGKRRPKTTWRRTVERGRGKAKWKRWNVAWAAARDRGVGRTM